jgi:site-specific DNA-methyltransferase (adenine-specific)
MKRLDGGGHWPSARGAGGLGTAGHAGQGDLDERFDVGVAEAWECTPDCPVRLLDEQSGNVGAFAPVRGTEPSKAVEPGAITGERARAPGAFYEDTGGASRFFYTPKANKAERNLGGIDNRHPTVKPLELMRWLCRLVTPPGGIILDPFAGSGSTVVAALREGFRCIGIEREADYARTARIRIEEDAPLFRRSRERKG